MHDFYTFLLSLYINKWNILIEEYPDATNFYLLDDFTNNLKLLKIDETKLLQQLPTTIPRQTKENIIKNLNDTTQQETQTVGILSILSASYDIAWNILQNAFVHENPVKIELEEYDSTIIPPLNTYYIKSIKLYSSKTIIPSSLLCFFRKDTTTDIFNTYHYIPTYNIDETTFIVKFKKDITITSSLPLSENQILSTLDTTYNINISAFKLYYTTKEVGYNINLFSLNSNST